MTLCWRHQGRTPMRTQPPAALLHTLQSLTKTRQQEFWKEALHQLDRPGVQWNLANFTLLMRKCGNVNALPDAKYFHDQIIRRELDGDLTLSNVLLQMYGKCEALDDARAVFSRMQQWDLSSWNLMIRAYTRLGHINDAFLIFQQMQREGTTPNKHIFVSILSAYAGQAALWEGKQMHNQIARSGCESDVFVGTALVSMYGNCGSLEDARRMFDKMPERDTVLWNTMITVYVQHGLTDGALELFNRMPWEGTMPNNVTFVSVLEACGAKGILPEGKQIHISVIYSGLDDDIFVGTALMNMYGKCGILHDARRMFSDIHEQDSVSWNAIIAAHAQNGEARSAVQLFDRMRQEDIFPDKLTFVTALSVCASETTLTVGKQIHAVASTSELALDIFMGNALVSMYGKCGSLDDSERVFYNILEPNVVSCNAMISAYTQHGQARDGFHIFGQMQQEGIMPDNITFVSIFETCGGQAAQTEGKQFHARIFGSEFESDVAVGNALVNMYGKWGCLEDAQSVFDEMFIRDKITFMNIVSACGSKQALREGNQIHSRIIESGFESDLAVGTALVSMYGKCGSLENARKLFDKLSERDAVLWTAMIDAYARNGQGKDSLRLFEEMQLEGLQTDKIMVVSILDACAGEAVLVEGKQLHTHIIVSGFESDVVVGTALVDMYGKCGHLEDARRVFDNIPQRDGVTWTGIIASYAQHGQAKESLDLFDRMRRQGVIPNTITFTSILSVCSHCGLVDEGCHCFRSMRQNESFSPAEDHYNCMVDLLGRAGLLDEAETLVNGMPLHPSSVTWTTLLGACREQIDVERGERAAGHAFELDSDNASPYITLSNIYCAAGRAKDVERLINLAAEKDLKLLVSSDFSATGGTLCEFWPDKQLHVPKQEINGELQRLSWQIEEQGYDQSRNMVFQGIEYQLWQ